MQRRLSRAVMTQVMDALNMQRTSALLSLPFEENLSMAASTTNNSNNNTNTSSSLSSSRLLERPLETERAGLPFLREAVLRAVENTRKENKKEIGNTILEKNEVGTLLEGRRLVGINLACTNISATFNRSDFSSADFTGAFVGHSTFNLARMRECNLEGAQFHSCTFLATDAKFINARGGRFSHCIFTRSDLSGWDVCGATFYRCVFTMSDLSDWSYDGQTVVVEPIDWGRCRRLQWRAASGCNVRECRVIGDGIKSNCSNALSLPPRSYHSVIN